MRGAIRAGTVAALAAASFALAACGSSTVEEDAEHTSVAPLPRQQGEGDSTTTTSRGADGSAKRDQGSSDIGAREVEEPPEADGGFTPEQNEYLKALSDKHVDVKGLEGAVVGAGDAVCSGDDSSNITANAIAGQLVELGRTDLTAEDAAALIVDEAKSTYC